MKSAIAKAPAKSFESVVEDSVPEQIRQALLGSRKTPEVIYIKDKTYLPKAREILVALHGLRGERATLLVDPDLRSSFEIRWL